MLEDIMKLTAEDEQRILNTLDFFNKHPETGYKEVLCSAYIERQFRELGYSLQLAGDIPGFCARIDTGKPGPCVLVLGELDAIKCQNHPEADPKTGAVHACGHSAQSAALVGVAAGLIKPGALKDLCGSIILCSVPAEEMIERDFRDDLIEKGIIKYYGGKPEFMYRGYFDDVDVAFMVHTSNALRVMQGSVGIISKKITYKGKAAHAGGAPQDGINALYAANLGLSAVNAIRETFTESEMVRVHPIITNGGAVVSGIPDNVELECFVRAKTYDALERTNKKVNRALIGAALSIGANIDIMDAPGYAPLANDENMSALAQKAAKIAYPNETMQVMQCYTTGSTDMGDISSIIPAVHPYAPGAAGTSHGEDYEVADPTLACIQSAKWQLAMIYMLLSDGGKEAKRIKEEFTPAFESKEAYFAYIDRFFSKGNRIDYSGDAATVKLNS